MTLIINLSLYLSEISYGGVASDFLELAVQFGMVTMFASAYPLIASFALVVST